MIEINKSISRLNRYINLSRELEIWIVSDTTLMAKAYWNTIKKLIPKKIKPRYISNQPCKLYGLSSSNAVILLCGQWQRNRVTGHDVFKNLLDNAKYTIPLDESIFDS